MGTVSKPNTFASGGTAASAEVNSNFDTIYNEFNGGIDNDNIDASAAIALSKLAADAWDAYTPTFANLTVGNGTLAAAYKKIGRTIHYRISLVLGSGSSVGTSPTFTLPATAATHTVLTPIGEAVYFDAAPAYYSGQAWYATTTTATMITRNVGSNLVQYTGLTASVPFTWAAGDKILITGTYESAA